MAVSVESSGESMFIRISFCFFPFFAYRYKTANRSDGSAFQVNVCRQYIVSTEVIHDFCQIFSGSDLDRIFRDLIHNRGYISFCQILLRFLCHGTHAGNNGQHG